MDDVSTFAPIMVELKNRHQIRLKIRL